MFNTNEALETVKQIFKQSYQVPHYNAEQRIEVMSSQKYNALLQLEDHKAQMDAICAGTHCVDIQEEKDYALIVPFDGNRIEFPVTESTFREIQKIVKKLEEYRHAQNTFRNLPDARPPSGGHGGF